MSTTPLNRTCKLLLTASLVLGTFPLAAAPAAPMPERAAASRTADVAEPYASGEVIVRFAPNAGAAGKAAAHARAGVAGSRSLKAVPGLEVARLRRGHSVEDAIASYERMPGVLYAEPNYRVTADVTPSDSRFAEQWGLNNTGQTVNGAAGSADADIDAPEAWAVTTGSPGPVIAVIDSGVDYNHPDLDGAIWTNPAETPGNGLDDDGNGFVDDVRGWDFSADDANPMDEAGHGTAVAGVIAAESDNATGVAGVVWGGRIMPLRFLDANGSGYISDAIDAIYYADSAGADIINCSWGGWHAFSQAEHDAFAALTDTLFVAAAGNEGLDIGNSWPGGVLGGFYYGPRADWLFYPARLDLDNILVAGATDQDDARALFSNYSTAAVDVSAPGENILAPSLPVTGIAGDAIENQIFSDEFDADLANWMTVAYAHDTWEATTTAYTSESTSAALGDYQNNEISYLDQDGFLDMSSADYPVLRFQARYDLEPGADYLAWGIYDASRATFDTLGGLSGTTGGAFEEVVIDLREYAGQNDIALWFGLHSDATDSSAQGYDGVWVDDVEVFDLDPADGVSSPWVATYEDAYDFTSGTSFAAPYVAGVAGMLLSLESTLTPAHLKTAIVSGADVLPGLGTANAASARLNAYACVTAPIALGDEFASEGAAPAAAAVLGEQGALSLAAEPGTPISIAAPGVLANDADPNGAALTAELISGPAHGTLQLAGDGAFTYTADKGYFGPDSFLYRARDEGGTLSAPALVKLEVVNVAPAAATESYRVLKGTTLRVDASLGVLSNDSDVNNDDLAAAAVTEPAHGSLALDPDGGFAYEPDAGWTGADAFSYVVSDGLLDAEPVTVSIDTVARLMTPVQGDNRLTTAVEASKVGFPGGAGTVVLATAGNWPDAVGGAALAGAAGGPVLLTYPNAVSTNVLAEIKRLGAAKVYLVGGTAAISPAVEAALAAQYDVERISGRTRYDTANKIAEETVRLLGPGYDGGAVIATGRAFPDALGASPLAVHAGMPIYLVDPAGLTSSVATAMKAAGVTDTLVLGGTGAIPDAVARGIRAQVGATTERISGADRYATARAAADHGIAHLGMRWSGVALATGESFPDALSAGAMQGANGSVLLLTSRTVLAEPARQAFSANKDAIYEVRLVGGPAAIGDSVRRQVASALE